jgi:hypothetical protein
VERPYKIDIGAGRDSIEEMRWRMTIRTLLNRLISMNGYRLTRVQKSDPSHTSYNQDGLWSIHNHDFMSDPIFRKAYMRGCRAASDYKWHWRVHIGLWAAWTASKLDGDFVECGVNRGFLSSSIMEFLDWDSLNKTFYLLDTFSGPDLDQISTEDLASGFMETHAAMSKTGFYIQGSETVKTNFSQWKNIKVIEGTIPATLGQVDARKVAFLHLDLNCSLPEAAALNFFWDRLMPGAVVLLDDYAYRGFESQKRAMDVIAEEKQAMIASLPTGQGLLIKPPARDN